VEHAVIKKNSTWGCAEFQLQRHILDHLFFVEKKCWFVNLNSDNILCYGM
jgi:hypothetical protein